MNEKRQRTIEYLEVPAGAHSRACNGKQKGGTCERQVYWAPNKNGKNVPVDCEYDEQCFAPSAKEAGKGANHFQTCADAGMFSKGRERQDRNDIRDAAYEDRGRGRRR